MWRFGRLGSLLALTACTSENPAYQEPDTGESTSPPQGSSTTTRGDTTEPLQSSTASDSGGGSAGDETPLPAEYCLADLYAVNESGELYLLDADTGVTTPLLADPRLISWAIATHPTDGKLYVSERDAPATVWRVQPFPEAVIDEQPLTVEADELETMARATFDLEGNLWLGTDTSHRFVWLSPSGDDVGEQTLNSFAWGGDMMFLEPGCAWVPALDGRIYEVCFSGPGESLTMMEIAGLRPGAQFTGIANDAMGRTWLATSDLLHRLIHIELDAAGWRVVQTVEYDVIINDLAPVLEVSGC